MPEIELTQGKVAMVDVIDFEWVQLLSWQVWKKHGRREQYAMTGSLVDDNGAQLHKTMHRMIGERMGMLNGSRVVHHRNDNGLDNRRSNLAIVSHREHHLIHGKRATLNSPYRFVYSTSYWSGDPLRATWSAQIQDGIRYERVGGFHTAEEASIEADRLLRELSEKVGVTIELNNVSPELLAQTSERYREEVRRRAEGRRWFRPQIRHRREKLGLSQVDLGIAIGAPIGDVDGHKTCSSISRWENSKRPVPEKYVDKLRAVLGIGYMIKDGGNGADLDE